MTRETAGNIQKTLLRLARARMSPRELLSLTRKAHPAASKKEIIRAAFGTIITVADSEPEKARLLQNFAISERAGDDD